MSAILTPFAEALVALVVVLLGFVVVLVCFVIAVVVLVVGRVRGKPRLEDMGFTSKGNPRVMFRPYRHMGATGIREVVKWAHSSRGEYEPPSGCDSGMCGI